MSCTPALTRAGALLIRTSDVDGGQRPIEPCDVSWLSPDLWVVGGPDRTTAAQGVEITVVARVTNAGTVPHEDITVEAWVCDFTAGPLPTGRLDPPGRMTGFAPGPLNPGQSVVVECAPRWVPSGEQVTMNAGHLCLAANVIAGVPADGAELPSARPIVPCCDTHHAQRNIALVSGEATSGTIIQAMRFWAAPPPQQQGGGLPPRPLDPIDIPDELPILLEIPPAGGVRHPLLPSEFELLTSNELGRRVERWELADPDSAKVELEGDGVVGARRAEFVAAYDKPALVHVSITPPPRTKSGTVLLYDAITRNPETGDLLGGARLMALVV